jgi:hypothetical protein
MRTTCFLSHNTENSARHITLGQCEQTQMKSEYVVTASCMNANRYRHMNTTTAVQVSVTSTPQ